MKHLMRMDEATNPWIQEFGHMNLSSYPPASMPRDEVEVDPEGEPVLTWDSPTTGKRVYAYTMDRVKQKSREKYDRVRKITPELVDKLRAVAHDAILAGTDTWAQAMAIILIIAETGLRPGSKRVFLRSGHRGVMSLAPKNVRVDGEDIMLGFTGKSAQMNRATLHDGVLANYLEERMKGIGSEDLIFDVSMTTVDKYFDDAIGMPDLKVKDLRTYVANRLAKQVLSKTRPTIPKDKRKIKNVIKRALKGVFEEVSRKLNNTPAVARTSYVDPDLINSWMNSLGLSVSSGLTTEAENAPDDMIGNAPVYDLPEWWDDDSVIV